MVRRRRKGQRWYEVRPDGGERLLPKKPVDWSRLNAMTDAEKLAAARSDPDAKPLTEAQLSRVQASASSDGALARGICDDIRYPDRHVARLGAGAR